MTQDVKPDCIICQILAGKIPSKKIYEDEEVMGILDMNGANPGHTFVFAKKHHPILEQIPDALVGRLFTVANKISSAIFDSMNIQGTNIFVANGTSAGQVVAHFLINVIPRLENDGINLQWATKKLNDEEMSTVELKLKEQTEHLGGFEEEAPAAKHEAKPVPVSGQSSHIIKQLRRIP